MSTGGGMDPALRMGPLLGPSCAMSILRKYYFPVRTGIQVCINGNLEKA